MGQREDRPDSARSQLDTMRSPSPESVPPSQPSDSVVSRATAKPCTPLETLAEECESTSRPKEKKLTLEEENRQLKEARLCKVCMDCEVSR